MKPYNPFTFLGSETNIVWRFDPTIFPFVREAFMSCRNGKRPITMPKKDPKIVIGYAQRTTGDYGEHRRYFYIMPYDNVENIARPPMEAVDPLTVSAQVEGAFTNRCLQTPTPEQAAQMAEIVEQNSKPINPKQRALTAKTR